MLFIWIALLGVSFIVFIADTKSKSNRYASLTFLSLSMGPAADCFRSYVIPFFSFKQHTFMEFSLLFNGFLYTVSIYFPFYFILLYSVYYSDCIKFKHPYYEYLFKTVLLLAPISMYFFVPISSPLPHFSTNYIYLAAWTMPYMVCTHVFLITAYLKEKHRLLKTERLVNMAFIIPTQIILALSEIVIPIFKSHDNDYLHFGLALYLILYFSFFTARMGFLGVRIVLQKNRSLYEKRLLDSSISIFNHSIKNEISKISLCASLSKSIPLQK